MDKLLAKDIAKGKIQEGDARQVRERVSVVDQAVGVRALRDVDMVIEVRGQTDSIVLLSLLSIQGCLGEPRTQATHILRIGSRDKARHYFGHEYVLYFYHQNCCRCRTAGRICGISPGQEQCRACCW
jgi:hypothetical protein